MRLRSPPAAARKARALREKSIAGPMMGKRRPPKAGPTITAKFICTPPRVIAEASSSFWAISGTMDAQTGALNAKPIPSKKTVVRMMYG
jgi:hypothetical protein